MKTIIKSLGSFTIALSILFSVGACSKNQEVTAEAIAEESALLQSPFHPEEQSPGAEDVLPDSDSGAPRAAITASLGIVSGKGGDGGFLPGPGGTGTGGDTGSVSQPGSNGTGNSNGSTGGGAPVNGSPTGGSASNGTTDPGPSVPGAGTPSENSSGSNPGSNLGETPSSPDPNGNDGGNIGGPTGSVGGDTGNTPDPIVATPSAPIPPIVPSEPSMGPGGSGGTTVGGGTPEATPAPTASNGTPEATPAPTASNGTPEATQPSTPPGGNDGGTTPPGGGIPVVDVGGGLPEMQPIPSTAPSQPEPGSNPVVPVNNPTDPVSPLVPGDSGETEETGSPNDNGIENFKRKMKIVLSRVCSLRRSATDYLFFEEAEHRILTLEAVVPKALESKLASKTKNKVPFLAFIGLGGGVQPKVNNVSYPTLKESNRLRFLVGEWDLSQVDLFKGKYLTTLEWSLKKMKQELGSYWKTAVITVNVCEDANGNGFCGDEKVKNVLTFSTPSFRAKNAPKTVLVDVWHGRNKTRAEDPNLCEKQYSPVVLDLTGNGISLIGPESGVRFDLNATGNRILTGWVRSQTVGFLVHDLNRNGKIESGAELFGNATTLSTGVRAINGFEAMKDLDSNRDGKLDRDDSSWSELQIWVDKNSNGETERGELYSLGRLQIESFNLNYIEMMDVDSFGNQTRQRSTFTRRVKGQLKPLQMIDVWFNTFGD